MVGGVAASACQITAKIQMSPYLATAARMSEVRAATCELAIMDVMRLKCSQKQVLWVSGLDVEDAPGRHKGDLTMIIKTLPHIVCSTNLRVGLLELGVDFSPTRHHGLELVL